MSVIVWSDNSYPIVVDAVNGSSSGKRYGSAFQTLQQAYAAAQAGDYIFVRSGTYASGNATIYKAGISWHFARDSVISHTSNILLGSSETTDRHFTVTGNGVFSNSAFINNTNKQSMSVFLDEVRIIIGGAPLNLGAATTGAKVFSLKYLVISSAAQCNLHGADIPLLRSQAVRTAGRFNGGVNGGSSRTDMRNPARYLEQGTMFSTSDIFYYINNGTCYISNADMALPTTVTYGCLLGTNTSSFVLSNCTLRCRYNRAHCFSRLGGTMTVFFENCRFSHGQPSVMTNLFYAEGSQTPTADPKLALYSYTFSGSTVTTEANHPWVTGDAVKVISTTEYGVPIQLTEWATYYARKILNNTLSLHPSESDAMANTNAISLSGGSGTHYIMGL